MVLAETIDAYTVDTRAVDGTATSCYYLTPDRTRQCAVGRCFNSVGVRKYHSYKRAVLSLHDEILNRTEYKTGLDDILKPQYQGLPMSFWSNIQTLHDARKNWDKNGLSKRGKAVVEMIEEEFDL